MELSLTLLLVVYKLAVEGQLHFKKMASNQFYSGFSVGAGTETILYVLQTHSKNNVFQSEFLTALYIVA
jgi:hypothetical protein